MNLQTKIPLSKHSSNLIDYKSNILLLGSCFSENIGKTLDYFKFQNTQNPFGILFHPKAVETVLDNSVNGYTYSETDIFFNNERWHCFDAHSALSNTDNAELLAKLQLESAHLKRKLTEASHIVITLGTAWVYRFLESDKIVANCHKLPQKQFKKELLSVAQIQQSLSKIALLVSTINPKATLVFTVSPVRHLKDGFVENTQSKSHLIAAIHNFINQEASNFENKTYYFPSYEIMMDELRDYRFYAEDMIHPNQTAITYIWEHFKTVWISKESYNTMATVDTIQKGLRHKPFHPNSEAHQHFIQKLNTLKAQVCALFPHITF